MLIEKGFSKVTYKNSVVKNSIIIRKGQYQVTIPPQGIKLTGFIKTAVLKALNNLTVENMIKINHKYGVTFEMINSCAA